MLIEWWWNLLFQQSLFFIFFYREHIEILAGTFGLKGTRGSGRPEVQTGTTEEEEEATKQTKKKAHFRADLAEWH